VGTHDLGRQTGGGGIVTDGESIFVPTREFAFANDVLVVDADSYEVTDTILTLSVNGVALLDDALWTTGSTFDVVQKFELTG
jgi:hypothetical protein